MSKTNFSAVVQSSTQSESGNKVERKPMLVNLPVDQIREIKKLAIDLDMKIQDVVSEAFDMMLARHGRR